MAKQGFTSDADFNKTALERAAGQKAARAIRRDLRAVISQNFNPGKTKELLKSTSRMFMKGGGLQRIQLRGPHYLFKHHYGFEGIKSNGARMSLKATNVLNLAVEKTGAIETLATDISEIRADEMVTRVNF